MHAIADTVPPTPLPCWPAAATNGVVRSARRDERPRASIQVGRLSLGKTCQLQTAARQAVGRACHRALQWCDPWQP
jgi:hypothetical protein